MSHKYLYSLLSVSGLLLILLFSANPVQAQKPIPSGSYQKTCKNIKVVEAVAATGLWAMCEAKDGSYKKSSLDYQKCEGDIYNDNGVLSCKKKPGQRPPKGTYQKSCKDIRVDGKHLKAKCEKRNGNWSNTSINYKNCKSDISNDNGELSCGGGGGKIPKGSYRDSCKNSYVEGKWLYSNCKKKNGSWNKTSLKYKDCNKDIKNDNGNLTCGGGNSSKYPKGSYKKSCKNLYMEGKLLEADCKKDNGKWKHSSINYKNCNKGIWNDNGKLRCNK